MTSTSVSAPSSRAPVLFISHGAPTFAMEPGELGPMLNKLGHQLDGIRAVLVVSPHWETHGVHVMTSPQPDTLHDFGGFPRELYSLRYPSPGAPEVALRAAQLIQAAGFELSVDAQRPLDHGAWVPLMHLLPDARVPVCQVSMPHDLDEAAALRLGQALAPLRDQGVLIIGSGSLTHNLRDLRAPGSPAQAHAVDFVQWIRQAVLERDHPRVVAYRSQAPQPARLHPTQEHFLPLLVAMGASQPEDTLNVLDGGMTYGVLSMESYAWGVPQNVTRP